MLMNGGKYSSPCEGLLGKLGFKQSKQLYSHHCVDTFFELTDECREHGRTLGWATGSFGDLDDYQRVINHTGYTGTSIQMNLDAGVAVILLTNRVHPIDDGAVGRTRALVTNIISSAIN
jgi:CubicO group peptidase (beta-lactamase class C family)